MNVDLLEEIVEKGEQGDRIVLVTIISTGGSTPREEGTQMLVFSNGETKGTIGGGSGEEQAKNAALEMLENNRLMRKLEISLQSDLQAEEGMVCGGNQTLLLELLGGI